VNGFEELDWETAIEFAKRFGGLIAAALFILVGRFRKGKKEERVEETAETPDPEPQSHLSENFPIEPGMNAAKLSKQFSQEG